MSWIEKLYQTYQNNPEQVANPNDSIPLLPLFHNVQNAQLHVVLDGDGNFLDAKVVSREDAQTIIPATEGSAGRSGSKIAPYPLCDTLQYVAGDYLSWGGNPKKKKNESGFERYIETLQGWVDWSNNRKLRSVLTYLRKGQLIKDLVRHKVLFEDSDGKLAEAWTKPGEVPPIFKTIKQANKKGQYEAFVRFSVEIPGEQPSELWRDPVLQKSWSEYYPTILSDKDVCMVTGKISSITSNHPKGIRYPGDGAKLISSNDTDGFTYLGRFTKDTEACSIGMEVTQKAHSALRWLIGRQGRRGDQAVVAWAVSGVKIPDPLADTFSLVLGSGEEMPMPESGYAAQHVGIQFTKLIAGYSAKFDKTEDIVVLALDSATPGRMAIKYHRELTGSEYLERIFAWHEGCRWQQRFSKEKHFVGAPAPGDIAEAAFATWHDGKIQIDERVKKSTIERLLPCIVDGVPIPRDLVESCIRRASSRHGFDWKWHKAYGHISWEWEKVLGIACALYRYQHKERGYSMALDRNRKTRDYLYGRLLALAEHLEGRALYVAGEERETNAGRLMQRFAECPYMTWLTIETALTPYKVRLRTRRPAFLHNIETEIDEVMNKFTADEFIADHRLSGEFLLSYHCQRSELRKPKPRRNAENSDTSIEVTD